MALVSPNEMIKAAEEIMLDGGKPETREDWMLVMNFLAANVHKETAEAACLLMGALYDMPLSRDEIRKIVEFQVEQCN